MRPRELVDLLAAVVADPAQAAGPVGRVEGAERQQLVDAAFDHQVPGSLALALKAGGGPSDPRLSAAMDHARVVHLQTSRALRTLSEAFAASRMAWAVVKGPALARLWRDPTITRTYSDLDLLVSRSDLRAAIELLEGCGFGSRNSNWRGFVDLGVAEVPFDDGSVVVDLHWNVVALASVRRHVRFDTDAMLARAELVELGGVEIPVLSARDAFAHTASHAGLAGARSLRSLHDVLLSSAGLTPGAMRSALSEVGIRRLGTGVLARALSAFGGTASAPDLDPVALGLGGWRVLNGVVDRVWSAPPARHVRYPGAVLASGRDSLAATALALLGAPVKAARARLGLPVLESEGGPLDWNHVEPADSALGLARYLDYVEGMRG